MPLGPISQPGASARLPTAPTSVSASATAGTVAGTAGAVTVSFVASTNPGKGPGNYVATSSPGGFTSSASVSPISFASGVLAAGTAYTFSIVKQSGPGISSATSLSSSAVTAFTVPAAPAAPTVTIGTDSTTIDTFTWVAPANNGSAITTYGYQTSTDNGSTWSAETYPYNSLTLGIETAYTSSSYKLRVRAYNAAGAGPYSTISTNGTGAWALGAITVTQTCAPFACSCGACACGTNNGTNSTATQSRTCYTWTRAGSTTSSNRDADGTTPCSSSYGSCTGGSCVSCSGCGTVSTVSGTDGQTVYVGGTPGQDYRTYSSFFGAWAVTNSGGTYTMQTGQCGGSCSAQNCFAFSTSVTQCSSTGAYTAVGYTQQGLCANFGFGCTGVGPC